MVVYLGTVNYFDSIAAFDKYGKQPYSLAQKQGGYHNVLYKLRQ